MIDVRDHEKDHVDPGEADSQMGMRDQGNAREGTTYTAPANLPQGSWLQPNTHLAPFLGLDACIHAA
jgi:hypothetical protein